MPCGKRKTVGIATHFRHTVVAQRHSVPTLWPIHIPGAVLRPVHALRSIKAAWSIHTARTIHTLRAIAHGSVTLVHISVSRLAHRSAHRWLLTFQLLLVINAFLGWPIVAARRIRSRRSVRLHGWRRSPIIRSTPSVVLRGLWLHFAVTKWISG